MKAFLLMQREILYDGDSYWFPSGVYSSREKAETRAAQLGLMKHEFDIDEYIFDQDD